MRAADLSKVPQIHETQAQHDERMQWFRDAKFGMFIHWGFLFGRGEGIRPGSQRQPKLWDINGIRWPRLGQVEV
ncbi:MAG: alpha-L-fucosidase [Akkermansiaceae bacterium]|nr:alpha-L-fucosidase [Akkermansiaceae bacterium]MCF7732891.1 alpha-L-fucosidase [Akkermansiaceae bacterium]